MNFSKRLAPVRPKAGEKADQILVVEYTTVATITRKTKEYSRVQQKTKILPL